MVELVFTRKRRAATFGFVMQRVVAIYEFPPFFTKQINEQTWAAQKSNWEKVCLEYCKRLNQWTLDKNSPVFTNSRIQRTLPAPVVLELFNNMVENGTAAWKTSNEEIYVYTKSPKLLASELVSWAEATGHSGAVITLYELTNGDLSGLKSFESLDPGILSQVLEIILKQGNATEMRENGEIVGLKLK